MPTPPPIDEAFARRRAETAVMRGAVRGLDQVTRRAVEQGLPVSLRGADDMTTVCVEFVLLVAGLMRREAVRLGQDPDAVSLVIGTVASELALVPEILRRVRRQSVVEHAETLTITDPDLVARILSLDPAARAAAHLAADPEIEAGTTIADRARARLVEQLTAPPTPATADEIRRHGWDPRS